MSETSIIMNDQFLRELKSLNVYYNKSKLYSFLPYSSCNLWRECMRRATAISRKTSHIYQKKGQPLIEKWATAKTKTRTKNGTPTKAKARTKNGTSTKAKARTTTETTYEDWHKNSSFIHDIIGYATKALGDRDKCGEI